MPTVTTKRTSGCYAETSEGFGGGVSGPGGNAVDGGVDRLSRYEIGSSPATVVTVGATMYDDAPHGASHIAPIIAQPSKAIAIGPDKTHRARVMAATTASWRPRISLDNNTGRAQAPYGAVSPGKGTRLAITSRVRPPAGLRTRPQTQSPPQAPRSHARAQAATT